MLAQNFKTAAELDLSNAQHSALIKVLALFDGGLMKHRRPRSLDGKDAAKFTGGFNMDQWNTFTHACGSVCCIGGTAELIAGSPIFDSGLGAEGYLGDLFFPPDTSNWPAITVEQGAMALRRYLTTGNPRWDLALAD